MSKKFTYLSATETSNIKNIDMRTKLAIKSENMTSFGGIFTSWMFSRASACPELINSTLGEGGQPRPVQLATSSCPFFLHISLRRRPHRGHHVLSGRHFFHAPEHKSGKFGHDSPRTEGTFAGQCHLQERLGASYAFNTAEKLNRLLLSMLFRLGLLPKGRRAGPGLRPPVHPAGNMAAKYSTKQAYGYFPAYSVSAACCSA